MLLTPKTYDAAKEKLYHAQNGICPICKRELDKEINKNHLDHDHELDGPQAGRVRGLLCNLCNGSEGRTRHEFMRSGLASRDIDYIEYLEALLAYLKQDSSNNDIHPKLVPDLKKRFARQDKPTMIAELQANGFAYNDGMTKAELCKVFNKEMPKKMKKLHN